MKSFLLAAMAAAGLLVSTSTADAQWRYRRAGVYTAPTYSTYSYPTYSGSPTYTNSEVIQSSYYTPTNTYPSGTVIQSSYYTPSSTYPMYSNGTYYNNGYYNNGYKNGINVTPSGVNYGNRRMWRW
jgi:hypothetical protein